MQGTIAFNINDSGMIDGFYRDPNNVDHGFLRWADGVVKVFDAPGAGTGPMQGTHTSTVDGINREGALSGLTVDDDTAFHGFVRAPDWYLHHFQRYWSRHGFYARHRRLRD